MKKIILLSIIIHCSLLIAYSQYGWYQQYSGTTNNLNGFCYLPGSYYTFFAVGDNGIILSSTNFGNNWYALNTPTSNNLFSICTNWSSSIGYAWIAGANGTILRTTNLGANWIVQQSGTSNTLKSVSFFIATTGIAVGNSGAICRTTNTGNNWIVTTYGSANLNSVCMVYSYALAVGDNGKIYRSVDRGQTWNSVISGTNYNLNSVTCLDVYSYSNIFFAAGNNGIIIKSTDSGINWSIESSGTSVNLYSIFASGYPLCIWAAGDNGLILKSLYGFTGWIDDTSRINTKINNIFMGDANTGWAVGNNGTIIHTSTDTYVIDSRKIDGNTISTWFRNNSNFNRDPVTSNAGFEWPKGSNKFARYASGPWIGAKVGNDTLVAVADYDYEYYPGYTDNLGLPHGANDPAYRMYRLNYGISDSDRIKWPNALLGNSNQGAPVYYDEQTHVWKPLDFADQTMFYCYTDSYPEVHYVYGGTSMPLKADFKKIDFAFDEPGAMGNIIYDYFTIINRNTIPWIKTYFTIWADDDLGYAIDDNVGCDTLLDLGYTYNSTNYDQVYGSAPPAVGFDFIKGPMTYTGNNNDTAFICYGKNKRVRVGYKQLGISAFNWYWSAQEPHYYNETYRTMSGLHPRKGVGDPGLEIINPLTHLPTHFYFSGDPVTSTGWIQTGGNDQRFIMSVGPFDMNPGDTQTIVVAQIIARGTSNLNSITVLRQYTQIARDNYKNCFANVPIGIGNLSNEVPIRFSLEQNYPNPFNPITKIRFSVPLNKGGLRGLSVKLTIYDILGREVAVPINQEMKPGHYEVEWDGSNFASGVYFYKLEAGSFVETKKMVLIK